MKENKTIHVISTVTLVTLFAKLLGIVRESLQARTFGTQIAADPSRSPPSDPGRGGTGSPP